MCGIFGIISTGNVRCDSSHARRLIESFYVLSESRGKEAAGAALLLGDRIEVVKAPVRGRDFLALAEARVIVDGLVGALAGGSPFVLIGHTRMVTNGGDHVHGNNQPVIRSGLVAIHNGIIVNEDELWSSMPDEARQFEVDTEVLLALVSRLIRSGQGLADAVGAAMRDLKGANSIALMSSAHDGLMLATANGSMFLAHEQAAGLTVFASERSILERIIEKRLQGISQLTGSDVVQVIPGEMVTISLASGKPTPTPWSVVTTPALPSRPVRTIADNIVARVEPSKGMPTVNRSRQAEIAAVARIDWQAIRGLRRCTRCVLPETFPFIEFDASGICSLCNSHKPLALKGADTLRREFEGIKRRDGRPEVLMPLSGGRDSCYGLHMIVREFGMKAIAYTYDWGMVTDLARRNISRMCGELGIEHVLISADIRRKREFIRKNVAAWLRAPHLGTIPLFMAGDKQFFYYANMLKNEMGIARTMLSVNPLERTDFKVGFCNINELYHKKHYYEPNFVNKLRLLGFYAGQFISNSGYINDSLIDTAFAYFSYYMIPKDFTSVFEYLPWPEHEIESVLLGQYNWETSPDTKSTWRIGDGTASFYNYIYVKAAGFSENDTFRSNQIREGLITRDEAMARIYEDNQPRVQSIAWYFDTIGLDAVEAIKTINRMPIRY
ncbi:MAG: hypothetical protein Q8O34_03105 [Rhodocyclaceae bacterium]|nr:hypothetical protein [Rhodocyclaceae bacterium]